MPDDTSDQPETDPPVPAPGDDHSSAAPGVKAARGDDPQDEGDGAWTALAAPGKPDGEVDTRS